MGKGGTAAETFDTKCRNRFHALSLATVDSELLSTLVNAHFCIFSKFTTLLSTCAHINSTTACMLLVLLTEQVLAHYLMIEQLSATTNLSTDSSALWSTIVYSSEWWGVTPWIVLRSALSLQYFLIPWLTYSPQMMWRIATVD